MAVSEKRAASRSFLSFIKVTAAFIVAMLVTLAIFLFMQHLISSDQTTLDTIELAAVVEIYRAPPKHEEIEPEPEPEKVTEALDEPKMDSVVTSVAEPIASVDQVMPSVNIGSISVNVGAVDGQWSLPVSGQALGVLDSGKDSKGYVEVVPYATRQPNIPEIALQNKINGWVLVVFSVTTSGHTSNVRILDANPKGIFEEEVQRAVGFWRYNVSALKDYTGDMVLTQKVELYWKDYPDNITY